jgi:DNA polymerase V
VEYDEGSYELDLFTDFAAVEKERNLQRAMLEVRKRFGMNAIVRGMNLLEGATTIERNMLIGGHKAGASTLAPEERKAPSDQSKGGLSP